MTIDQISTSDWHLKHLAEIYKFSKVFVLDKKNVVTEVNIRSDELKDFRRLIKETHPNATMILISIEDYKETNKC